MLCCTLFTFQCYYWEEFLEPLHSSKNGILLCTHCIFFCLSVGDLGNILERMLICISDVIPITI